MRRRVRGTAHLAVLFALAACHREAPRTNDAGASNAPGAADPCDAIAREHASIDAGVAHGGTLDTCLRTKHGAWGFVAADYAWPGAPTILVAPVHAEGGALVRGEVMGWRAFTRARVFDYDGDGEEELLVEGEGSERRDAYEEIYLPSARAFTWRAGGVSSWPAAGALRVPRVFAQERVWSSARGTLAHAATEIELEGFRDVDGDGRPDLTTRLFYDVAATDGDETSFVGRGPRFVAHALPGGAFSFDDAAAKKALADECATRAKLEAATGEELVAAAVCARLEGRSVAEIRRRYAARCGALLKANAQHPTGDVDRFAEGTCRVVTELGLGSPDEKGLPASLAKRLDATEPVLAMPDAGR